MPFVTASDGVELHYEVEGDGFPLVFTHGNMGFGQQFFLQTRILRKRYRCILRDLRGCGLSGKPQAEVYDTTIHASDLHTILQALGVTKAVHLGHSFGGPISLQYYFDYPGEVTGIVFLGSYSAGSQLTITEDQVLEFYDTIEGRQRVFQTFITHEKFAKYNPYGADIEAMLQKEACKPPIYASKAIVEASAVSTLLSVYRRCECRHSLSMVIPTNPCHLKPLARYWPRRSPRRG